MVILQDALLWAIIGGFAAAFLAKVCDWLEECWPSSPPPGEEEFPSASGKIRK